LWHRPISPESYGNPASMRRLVGYAVGIVALGGAISIRSRTGVGAMKRGPSSHCDVPTTEIRFLLAGLQMAAQEIRARSLGACLVAGPRRGSGLLGPATRWTASTDTIRQRCSTGPPAQYRLRQLRARRKILDRRAGRMQAVLAGCEATAVSVCSRPANEMATSGLSDGQGSMWFGFQPLCAAARPHADVAATTWPASPRKTVMAPGH